MIEVKDMTEYIKKLGGSDVLTEKAERLLEVAQLMAPEQINHVFQSETMKSEGVRIFNSLWFFTKKYCLECKEPLSENYNIDIATIYKIIERYELTFNNFNPKNTKDTDENARLQLEGLTDTVAFILNASGENVNNLWEIVENYFIPNITEVVNVEEE